MAKTKTPQQINKILNTYRKNNPALYKDILQLADQMGVATKSAFKPPSKRSSEKIISESKSKQKNVQRFYARISRRYGTSYTDYQRRQKKRYERYKQSVVDSGRVPLKHKSWEKSRNEMSALRALAFKYANDSNEVRDVVIVAETLFGRDEDEALNYLQREVERLKKDGKTPPDNPF